MLKTRKGIATVKNKEDPAFPNPNQLEKVILKILSRIVQRTICAREGDTRVSLSRACSFLRPLFLSACYEVCLSFIYTHEIVFQMFKGNYDRYIVVQHKFARPLYGRYFRVYPVSWYSYIGMRVEFYGCVYGKRYQLQVRLYKKCQLFS